MNTDELKAALVALWTATDAVPARSVAVDRHVLPSSVFSPDERVVYALRIDRADGSTRALPFDGAADLTDAQQYEAALQMLQAVARDMEEYRDEAKRAE